MISKVPLAAQFISKYAHDMLSKGLKVRFDSQVFEKVGLLSSYLSERSKFEQLYLKNLSNRLLESQAEGTIDWETQMISTFKRVAIYINIEIIYLHPYFFFHLLFFSLDKFNLQRN